MKVQVNGILLAYSDQGKGLPIVFLHGFPFNRTMWKPQAEALAGPFRVITLDLRGHGESEAPWWHYSMDQYADDVKGLLSYLAITKAVFVGLSMGGYLAFTLYRRYPELIQGLVFADTRAEADKPEQARWRFDLAQRTATGGAVVVVDEMLPKLLSAKTYATSPAIVERVKSIMETSPVPGIIGDLMAMAERPDSMRLLSSITVPTLVIVGEDDGLTTPTEAAGIAQGIPDARLVTIPGAGHVSNLEQPTLFNRAIEEFAAGLASRTG